MTTIAVAIIERAMIIKAAIEKSPNIVEIYTAFADRVPGRILKFCFLYCSP